MSDCSCVYVGESEYECTRTEKTCVARKVFECDECGRAIHKGTKYESVRWYIHEEDGISQSHSKTCTTCKEIRDTFFCNGYWAGMVFDNLFDHLEYIGGHVDSSCLAALSHGARERVCAMIEKIWEDTDEED